MSHIPFNRLDYGGNLLRYVEEALKVNAHTSGDGPFTLKCTEILQDVLGTQALLTTSGTQALELAATLLDFKAGDEFLIPSFTFPSTANAFLLRGMRPLFVDIRPDTLNIDERLLEEKITPRTRAIVPVHYAGVGCEMDAIQKIAEKHGLLVIEDNAHGLFGKYRGKWLGTFGPLAAQSFHETKNFSSGEGGAILINNPKYLDRAEIIREKGTNRKRFFRGQVDKYSWVDIGSSCLPSDILAGILLAQLERWAAIQNRRQILWKRYQKELHDWAADTGIGLPTVPTHCEQAYHLFYLIFPSLADRTAFIKHMDKEDIKTAFHYQPLHSSDMGKKLGGDRMRCPVAERVGDCLVRLPMFNQLTDKEQDRILSATTRFRMKAQTWRGAA